MTEASTETNIAAKTEATNAPLELVTAECLSKRWNGSPTPGTLRKWRCERKGPPFIKIGTLIRYDVRSADAWLMGHLHVPDAA